ncbi:hypothetical protein SLS53_000378 [Cytospora paraplurivora]|uniref:Alb1-domain-containing protein n=1 Tax=Cytospora paraplurivora TaxID=2898453 RepID=A0AAN9UXL0_9PEZI
MAKTNAKKGKAPSLHSRAARRATSPSINTDKSLKDVQPPTESVNNRPSVLGIHQSAGVTKKTKRGRKSVLSTKARKRHERGLERAEHVVDRTAVKIQKSKRSAAEIASRKKAWDEVNGSIGDVAAAIGGKASLNMFAGLGNGDDEEDIEEVDNFDDEMGDVDQGAAAAAATATAAPTTRVTRASAKAAVAPAAASPPQDDEDEEIL